MQTRLANTQTELSQKRNAQSMQNQDKARKIYDFRLGGGKIDKVEHF